MTEQEETEIGERIIQLLGLKKIKRGEQVGRYNTTWGTKTALGLYKCIERIIKND